MPWPKNTPQRSVAMPLAVVDAWALLAWLGREPGADAVNRWLQKAAVANDPLLISIVNAGEVFYRLCKAGDPERADEFSRDLRKRVLPVQLIPATNRRVWSAAGVKARYTISYADAFAATLAVEMAVPVLTGDSDFAVLEEDGICKIVWIDGWTPRPIKGRPISDTLREDREA